MTRTQELNKRFVLKFSFDEFDPAFDVCEKSFDVQYVGVQNLESGGVSWTGYTFDLLQPIMYADGRLAGTRFVTSLSAPPLNRRGYGDAAKVLVIGADGRQLPVGRASLVSKRLPGA